MIKDKFDALNPKKNTLVLLNQVKFLSYRHKSFLRFCSYIWLRWLCTVEVATKREAAGCKFVIMWCKKLYLLRITNSEKGTRPACANLWLISTYFCVAGEWDGFGQNIVQKWAWRVLLRMLRITITTYRKPVTGFIKCAYRGYFGIKLGDQEKDWAPHMVCKTRTETLRGWINDKRSLSFVSYHNSTKSKTKSHNKKSQDLICLN